MSYGPLDIEDGDFPPLDPDKNQIIFIIGRKGSGKSVNAYETFRGWPYTAKFVIDPTGDADPGADIGTVTLRTLPDALPAPTKERPYPVTRWVANPMSPTYREDLDRAVGLALFPQNRRTLLWVDEAGEVFPANQTGPYARLLLQQSRHWNTSVIMCCPRPITVNPLCLAQADRVIVYDLPQQADRDRVAAAIGIERKLFSRLLDQVKAAGQHWYFLYDAKSHSAYICPPIPLSKGYKHAQQ